MSDKKLKHIKSTSVFNYVNRHKLALLASTERFKKHARKHKKGIFVLILVSLILMNCTVNLIYDNLTFESQFASQIKHMGIIVDVSSVKRISKLWLQDDHGNIHIFYGADVEKIKPYLGKLATVMSFKRRGFFFFENYIASLQVGSELLMEEEKIKSNNLNGFGSSSYKLLIVMVLLPLVFMFVLTLKVVLRVYFSEFRKTAKNKDEEV